MYFLITGNRLKLLEIDWNYRKLTEINGCGFKKKIMGIGEFPFTSGATRSPGLVIISVAFSILR